jgi:hypothetical protein
MELEAYSDQLIRVLRQMRAQVIADRVDPELPQVTALLGALDIAFKWSGNRRPAPLPAGAGLREIADYAARYADALGLEEELVGAVRAINPDFSVEVIDNAIRVAESQA